MYSIGIDLGGTGIKAGVVDENGKIIAKVSCPTGVERGPEAVIRDMAKLCFDAAEKAGVSMDDIQSVGIGLPGIYDRATNMVPFCTNLGWHQVPVVDEMHKYIDKPVYIDNDATVAGVAEAYAGISKGVKNSVFVTLGTGVGGGIIIDGKPYSGTHGVGSEIGHMIIVAGGEPCTCGNRGCLERYCSATAIIRMAREAVAEHPESLIMQMAEGSSVKINAKIVIDAARENDPVACEVYHRYIVNLGQAIANLINFFDPEVIVLGGGVSKAGSFLLDAVRAEAAKYCLYKALPHSRIELAKLGPDAGIIGAAMLGK